jgi:hypothetical protein
MRRNASLHTHSAIAPIRNWSFCATPRAFITITAKLEYATAECSSPRECALHDKAGDHIVADMARQACRDGEILDVHNDNSMAWSATAAIPVIRFCVRRRAKFCGAT